MSLAHLFYVKEAFRSRVRELRYAAFRLHARHAAGNVSQTAASTHQFILESLEPRLLLSSTPSDISASQPLEPAAVTVLQGTLLDVDLNGRADALTDGIVITRHLFGFSGSALTDGAVDPNGQRTDPTAIAAYLDSIRPSLDVDLNGWADALSDGLVIMRSLFGFRGAALISGAVDLAGIRNSAVAVESFPGSFLPITAPTTSLAPEPDEPSATAPSDGTTILTIPATTMEGGAPTVTAIAVEQAPENGALVPLDLPNETLSDRGDTAAGISQAADLLTRLDDLHQRGRFKDLTGAGMTAVIVDTGIDVDHPFFGPDADGNGVADRIVYQWDFADSDADASDHNGHGSHVASLIGSEDPTYQGIAPAVDLISLKVFKDSGSGNFGYLEQALQWVMAHLDDYGIDVVNMSLGDGQNWNQPGARYGIGDELAALANKGVLLIAAAGNNFFTAQSQPGVAYPAADPNVIGVGAVWTADFGGPWRWSSGAIDLTTGPDRIASFSQRDPVMTEVFAPGARLVGANQFGGIATMQGTSQAAAYLSGSAILAQEYAEKELGRKLTPDEFVKLVTHTGKPIVDGDDENDNVTNTGDTFARVNVLQLAKGIHWYAVWERVERSLHHGNQQWAIAFAQRCWVKEFVDGTAAAAADEEELLITLPG